MFKRSIAALGLSAFLIATCTSCKKKADKPDEYATTDTTGTLKAFAGEPVGVGIRLDLLKSDTAYAGIVKTHFNSVTFENEFKHGVIVTNEGAYDYTKADEFVNMAQAQGLSIHGHTLVDFKSSNTTYLRSLTSPGTEVNVVVNPGFEATTGANFSNWITQVGGGAVGSFEIETANPYQGSKAMKVNVTTAGPQQFSMQAYSDFFGLSQGYSYTLSFYARANVHGSRFKAVIQNTTYQERTFFLTTAWEKYTWTFTAGEPTLSLKFHFPVEGVFYFDNVSIPRPASGGFSLDPVKVDTAMKQFITRMISRYKNKVMAWDVVNEPLEEGTGAIRTNPVPGTSTGDKFYFAEFLGRDYIAKAFNYAHEADPNAQLYINEDKLESDGAKLDSMVKLVNSLKAAGVPIHGIGVQMHITIKNDLAAIERAFTKLAATGLKIRISEMDVRINPWNTTGFTPSNDQLIAQRDYYRFAIGAYYRLVPPSQRAGITLWDPNDKYSWIVLNQGKEDFPNIFDVNYRKKPAYYGALVAMKKKN
ncbi:MAG: hypothetical protein K0Q66_1788 [Chitinophagaceae bacterium]|nr:hypothetical protein [Chitinophagaceae bacterium]